MKSITISMAILLMALTPLLTACSSSCDCPRCPSTTVVTPPHSHATVVTPDD